MSLPDIVNSIKSNRHKLHLPLIMALVVVLAVVVAPAAIAGEAYGLLPVSLQAANAADYSGDEIEMFLQPLQLALIADVLYDREPMAVDSTIRLTAVANNLLTPVPTSADIDPTDTSPQTESPENLGSPTVTGTPEPAASGTAHPSPTPTNAISPTPTNSPTQPTPTSAPPTATVNVCSQIYLDGYQRSGPIVRWDLHNNSGTGVSVTQITLAWPDENDSLIVVVFGGSGIWHEGDSNSPTSVSGSWSLGAGSTKRLLFQFSELAASSGYSISVAASNGCNPSASG